MRVLKDPQVRRAEILDTAEQLFITKGYNKTTIADILTAVGIAKGTFYYYFKSKEEVLDAVIGRIVDSDAEAAAEIAGDTSLSPTDKFRHILFQQKPSEKGTKAELLHQFQQLENAEMRQKGLVLGVRRMAPILASIVQDGVAMGLFRTPYPREAVEVLLVSGQMLFDDDLFRWSDEELAHKLKAFAHMAETLLGAAESTFGYMSDLLD